MSHRVVHQLSPHHDSQFSAFSTEVLIRINQKHNRSSSPFTTLADRMEHKVASTGAGQPYYWPKTWFGADAYKAKLVTPKCAIKLFGLVGNSFVPISSPWQFVPRCVRETTEEAKFSSWKKQILNTDYVHWNLIDMVNAILQIITPLPGLFDMPGVEGWEKRHFTGSK